MFEKLFGRSSRKKEETANPAGPDIRFGRYSDNNKSVAKVARWTDADNLFKERKHQESLDAFFDYIRDEQAGNVVYERNNSEGRFEVFQGSKVVRGKFNGKTLEAEVTLARMPQASVPVMRRLLEMNFNLYYSRFALDADRLCMRFDSLIESASPSKMYYGLKELSTKADKQDDLLVQDFTALQTSDSDHIKDLPLAEKEVKYEYMQKWIRETLDAVASVDADKFSGGIAYMLLTLIYRIDFLIAPEGKILHVLEKISGIYFKADERAAVEKNRDMIEEVRKLEAIPKEEIFKNLFRSQYTFAIVAPQVHKTLADSIAGSNANMLWYRDNSYPQFAAKIIEYGLTYAQYSYSLPRPVTELIELFMEINYADYFAALGFTNRYYEPGRGVFNHAAITERVQQIQASWKQKYPLMNFQTISLKMDNLVNFNHSFALQIEGMNMESK